MPEPRIDSDLLLEGPFRLRIGLLFLGTVSGFWASHLIASRGVPGPPASHHLLAWLRLSAVLVIMTLLSAHAAARGQGCDSASSYASERHIASAFYYGWGLAPGILLLLDPNEVFGAGGGGRRSAESFMALYLVVALAHGAGFHYFAGSWRLRILAPRD